VSKCIYKFGWKIQGENTILESKGYMTFKFIIEIGLGELLYEDVR
jgi:hypothetical protein